jgi:hypothetical protein
MTYVLIVILSVRDVHIAMQEFNSLETCQYALEQIKEMKYFSEGVCVPK